MTTHIAEGFKYKKDLKEFIEGGGDPYLDDPSVFSPQSGRVTFLLGLPRFDKLFVSTPPPHRWYAQVFMKDGKVKVK